MHPSQSALVAEPISRYRAIVPAVVCSLILAGSIVAAVFGLWNDGQAWGLVPFVFVYANAIVGSLIELRRPGNTVGRLLLGSALASSLAAAALEYTRYTVMHPASGLPTIAVLAGLPAILMPAASALLIFCVPLYFPDANQSSPRWRRLTRVALVSALIGLLIHTLRPGFVQSVPGIPNPFGLAILQPYDLVFAALEAVLMITALVIAVGRLFSRFRQARGDTRQQIKWLLYAVCAWIVLVIIASAVEPFDKALFRILDGLLVLLFSGIPVAIGMAILRHRLYDIDLIINRTLVYAGLTATIAALYAAVVVGLGALLQAQGSTALSLLATFLAAVLFSPIRSRLQQGVNRLLYGERADPYHALANLGQRLGGTLAPETVFATVVQTVGETLRLPYTGMLISREGQQHLVASYRPNARADGDAAIEPPPPQHVALPLLYRQDRVGTLLVTPRAGETALNAADLHLLQELARQAGTAVHALELTIALQDRMDDLRRSRERLFVAQEEERRRIQRDLHDGLGPLLVSMRMHLELCREQAADSAPQLEAGLQRLDRLLQQATTDIRRLVHNLRPPALDQLGLVGALEQYVERFAADTATSITFQAERLLLSAAAEVAIYRIVTESLTNIQKYASASQVSIQLGRMGDAVLLSLHDNGVGGAVEGAHEQGGVGIVGMRERAELLGGTLVLHSPPGGGTTLDVYLPLRDELATN